MKRRTLSRSRTTIETQAFKRVMVAVDSPEGGEKATDVAISIAQQNHAELVMLHVTPPPAPLVPPFGGGIPMAIPTKYFTGIQEEEERVSRWMTRVGWIAEEKGLKLKSTTVPADGSIAEQVTSIAVEEGVDLIVTGTADRSAFERFVMGSVSSEVTRRAKCPVLVVR